MFASRRVAFFVLVLLLLASTSCWAQAPKGSAAPASATPPEEVNVSIEVPKAVNVLRDYGQILLSDSDDQNKLQKLKDRFRKKTTKSTVDVTVTIPKNWITRKLGLTK
jgi:hypothetical protein